MGSYVETKFELLKVDYFNELLEFLNAMKSKFGQEAVDVVASVIAKKTKETWANIAEKQEKRDINTLVNVLWGYCRAAGYEFSVSETEETTQICCTKCPVYDMAKEVGATDWGYEFFCKMDPPIIEGFNPNIQFSRTKTLMEGDECCNHCYTIK